MSKRYQKPPPTATTSEPSFPYIPPQFRDAGIQSIHPYPLVLDDQKRPRGRRPAAVAWDTFPRVELQPPNCYAAIILDVDEPNKDGWPYGKPAILPTWIVQALDTGKMHVLYALETPVHRNPASLRGPLNKLANVADRLSYHLGGDPTYGGTITRNPIKPGPNTVTHWFSFLPYTLDQLDKQLPKTRTRTGQRLTGIGRNVDLFRAMVSEAHQPRWHRAIAAEGYAGAWLEHVREQNVVLWHPDDLPDAECRSIAKSCANYSLRQFSEADYSAIQTRKIAKRWHGKYNYDFEARDASILSLRELGFTQAEIARTVGLTQGRVSQVLKHPDRKLLVP